MVAIPEASFLLVSQAKRCAPIRPAQQPHTLPPRGANLSRSWKATIGQGRRWLAFCPALCQRAQDIPEHWQSCVMQQPSGGGSGNARWQRMGALCQHVAGINARGDAMNADAGRPRPFLQGPKGGDGAAMAGQQRGMDIHPTKRRQSERFQRENLIEMKGDNNIGPRCLQRRVAGSAIHIRNLKQRNAMRARDARNAMALA